MHLPVIFEGVTYERLKKEHRIKWPCPDESHPGTVRRYKKGDPLKESSNNQYDKSKQENNNRYFVDSMHKRKIGIPWLIWILLSKQSYKVIPYSSKLEVV